MKRFGMLIGLCAGVSACATQNNGLASSGTTEPADTPVLAADNLPDYYQPIALIPTATGTHEWPISSENPTAQAYFNQGMQLRWAYNVNEAARSMAEARRADPDCAMCYWGEAFALGSFLNQKMSPEKAVHAHAAITKAVELSEGMNGLERDLILATAVRYPANFDTSTQRRDDEAFASEMAKLYERYPDNHEIATVYAVSLFLLEKRAGTRDLQDPDVIRLHGVLKGVLDENIYHPGACHLYIHATESTEDPGLALECAEYLSDAIPVASHVQHMPSHTWNEVGQWGKSVRAGQLAARSDAMAQEDLGFSYGAAHNLHMMLFAASMDGQGAVAMQAGRDFTKATGGNTFHELLTLFRFGRFEEILEIDTQPPGEVGEGFWHFVRGYAELREGSLEAAEMHHARLKDLAENSTDTLSYHAAMQLLGVAEGILAGEMLRSEGDLDGAILAFKRAAASDDQQVYAEPEPINFAARHWLGAALLEAGRYAEAEEVYRTELADHPHNVWSLHGLKTALEAQGKSDAEVEADFADGTARADLWIPASRF